MLIDIYVPVQTSQNDLETLDDMHELIKKTLALNPKRIVRLLITMASTHASASDVQDAKELTEDYIKEMPLSDAVIKFRTVFRNATPEGLGVVEMSDEKATFEVRKLIKEIMSHV